MGLEAPATHGRLVRLRKGDLQLFIGYLITVVLMAAATALGLWAPRRPHLLARASFWVGQVIRELPAYALAWLLISTVLAWVDGAFTAAANWPALALASLTTVGLTIIAARGVAARAAVDAALTPLERASNQHRHAPHRWPSAIQGLLFPFTVPGRAVRRVTNIAYGSDRKQRLDVWLPRSRPADQPPRPVLVYLHGGGYFSGSRRRTAQELLARFARNGWVCVTADYRLRPQVGLDGHLADARSVMSWSREHAAEYGADPGPVVLIGSSAGAHMSSIIALSGDEVAAVVGYCGYYGAYYGAEQGQSSPISLANSDAPPFLVVDGSHDTDVPRELAAQFVARLKAVSTAPVVRIELPGAQHNFDLRASVRFGAVIAGTARFLDAIGVSGHRQDELG
ncbi:alpha/beta hydrolase [Micromonospora sp. NPDC006766]|uniref:alpha/beta hydrolase n=1 Tax=Micromonospora sp. NPDC006766 TaxID=3154778 RepID=UPI0033C586B5